MVIFNDFTRFSDKAKVAQIPQEKADDNKEALDRLVMQNQKLLGDPREIDASFVQTMHDGLSEDRAETQSFMRYFFYT